MDNKLENLLANLIKKIRPIEWWTFKVAFIFGMLTHIFFVSHLVANEDYYVPYVAYGQQYGRWLLYYVSSITPYPAPAIVGIFTVFLLAIIAAISVKIFDFQRKAFAFCIAVLTVTFPSTAYLSAYVGVLMCYSFALFLASLAAILSDKSKFGWIFGGIALGLSLAIYQAYLAVTMTLLLICLINYVAFSNTEELFWKNFFIKIAKYIGTGVLGVTIYYVGLKVFCAVTGYVIEPNYTGITEISNITLKELFLAAPKAYVKFASFFFGRSFFDFSFAVRFFALLMIFLAGIILLGFLFHNRQNWTKILIVLVMIMLLPLCVNVMELLSYNVGTTVLSCFSFLCIFVISLRWIEQYACSSNGVFKNEMKFYAQIIGITAAVIVSFNFYLISNAYYLKLTTYYERTYAFANRVLSRIETIPEFSQQMPVALIGQLPSSSYPKSNYMFPQIINDRGLWGQYIGANKESDDHKIAAYIDFYLGVPINLATKEQMSEIESSPQLIEMPMWPDEESVAIINGVITVKLNDVFYINVEKTSDGAHRLSTLYNTQYQCTYAWYIDDPSGNREFTQWYEPSNELVYQFTKKGKYFITLFVMNDKSEIVNIQRKYIDIP